MTVVSDQARGLIAAAENELLALSHRVHAHPELKFEEERSSAWVAGVLADHGLPIEMGVCDLPTAFVARVGDGPLHLSICAEYDALPAVGHACGHNIIAAAAVGAGLSARCLASPRMTRSAPAASPPPSRIARAFWTDRKSVV